MPRGLSPGHGGRGGPKPRQQSGGPRCCDGAALAPSATGEVASGPVAGGHDGLPMRATRGSTRPRMQLRGVWVTLFIF